jgi:murein DD-endopeptidase MepM/ murein hydrolase activator NlpD
MSNKTILFVLFSFSNLYSFSQPRLISCNTQNNADGSVSIFANSQANTEYTVKLTFTSLNGFTSRLLIASDVAVVPVNPGNREIIRMVRDKSATNYSLQYRYQYFPGKAFHKIPDTTMEYLLPAAAGYELRVTAVSSTVSTLSQQLKTDYRGTGFLYKLADTICASRAGIVFECSDTAKEGEKTEVIYRSGRNRISIEHKDGTIGIYGITAPVKLLVSAGDEVFPGQPLAVFNKESERYKIYFSTCYLDEKKLLSDNSSDNTLYFIYMPTHFYGNENDRSSLLQVNKQYTVQHPGEIIGAEMSKKEKKKFGLQ